MLVVVVDVLIVGSTGGLRGANRGERALGFTETATFSSVGGGISSRILRRHSIVLNVGLSCGESVDESD